MKNLQVLNDFNIIELIIKIKIIDESYFIRSSLHLSHMLIILYYLLYPSIKNRFKTNYILLMLD